MNVRILSFCLKITFGGIPFSGKPSSSSRKNFKGCMESINYNGNNITDLARRKKLEPSNVVRFVTPKCSFLERSRNVCFLWTIEQQHHSIFYHACVGLNSVKLTLELESENRHCFLSSVTLKQALSFIQMKPRTLAPVYPGSPWDGLHPSSSAALKLAAAFLNISLFMALYFLFVT